MGLFPGSVRPPFSSGATPIDIVLLDQNGDPVFGFDPSRPDTATQVEHTMTGATQLLLAANAARRQVIIENATNKPLYLAYAPTATAATRTETVPVGGVWRSDLNGYTGDISGILQAVPSSVNKVYVTEVTT